MSASFIYESICNVQLETDYSTTSHKNELPSKYNDSTTQSPVGM